MKIKQLSIFIENQPGRLYKALEILAQENINIRALSLADTSEFGILRLVVNSPENGKEILADVELLRLAVPRRVFTLSQINYVIDRMTWLWDNRHLIGGLKFNYEPPVLRFFMGGLEPTSNWPNRLMEKFREDFGDSL